MQKVLTSLIKILATIFIILLLCEVFVTTRQVGKEIFANRAKDPASSVTAVEKVITIHEGDSLLDISRKLEDKGIINNAYIFALSLRFSEDYKSIKPGDYEVNSKMKPSEILEVLIQKETKS